MAAARIGYCYYCAEELAYSRAAETVISYANSPGARTRTTNNCIRVSRGIGTTAMK